MRRKAKFYEAPAVRTGVGFLGSGPILASSVVTSKSKVRTTGQEVVTYDFSGSEFNQEWE